MDYQPPSELEIRIYRRLLKPWRTLLDPQFLNMDRIPTQSPGPLLFIGNHTLYGLLDVPHLYMELLQNHGIALRSMGDHAHFRMPGWSEFLQRFGAVDGTPEVCDDLLGKGEAVLIFPGGAREVAKRKGEKYTLVWKERFGFVKAAIRHGCTIIPFAMLGGDDAWDIVWDAEDLQESPFAGLVNACYEAFDVPLDSMVPIAKGLGPSMLPKPVRLYFSLAEPIDARAWAGREDDQGALTELRDLVADGIYGELDRLVVQRKWDPPVSLRRRLIERLLRSRIGRR